MGVILKALSFIIGLSLIGLGAGLIAVPLLLYALWGVVFRRKVKHRSPEDQKETIGRPRFGPGKKAVAGVALLVLAALAASQGGRFSAVLFSGIGMVLLLWDRLFRGSYPTSVAPATDSILLRSKVFPFSWLAVSEVKMLTKSAAEALSSVDETIVVRTSERPSVLAVVGVSAVTHSQAMERMTVRLQGLASVLLPQGGYVVPLDSGDAAAILSAQLKPVRFDPQNWRHAVRARPFDQLVLKPRHGFCESMGLYSRDQVGQGSPKMHAQSTRLPRPPLLWEVLKVVEGRVQWPEPDELAGYVASLGAKRGEALGNRVGKGAVDSQNVISETFAGKRVELKATQLRALVGLYE